MDEDTARTPLERALALDHELGALLDTVAAIPDEAPPRRFRRAAGDAVGLIARDLVFPIAPSHPALGPEP